MSMSIVINVIPVSIHKAIEIASKTIVNAFVSRDICGVSVCVYSSCLLVELLDGFEGVRLVDGYLHETYSGQVHRHVWVEIDGCLYDLGLTIFLQCMKHHKQYKFLNELYTYSYHHSGYISDRDKILNYTIKNAKSLKTWELWYTFPPLLREIRKECKDLFMLSLTFGHF